MEITINGDFKKGKELMKTLRQNHMKEIREIEKKHKKLKALPPTGEVNRLKTLNNEIIFYSVSKTLPVRYEGVIINGKLLQAFMKKLKGFYFTIEIGDESLLVQYGKNYGKWTGKLELYDISRHFEGFTDIPELEIYDFLD